MAPLFEVLCRVGIAMDWWMWGLFLFAVLGIIGYLMWWIIPAITIWYLRKKALSIGLNKANKLWQKVTDEDN
tara:strand:+ start:37 stop:252 length:216 start_codon:yes stop_codon:yes gene_type:complete